MNDLSKAEKLNVGGYMAPRLRNARATGHGRRIKVVDRNGDVSCEIDHVELAEKLGYRAGIEFGVEDGRRPEYVVCPQCASVFKNVESRHKRCKNCRTGYGQTVCAGFGGTPCPGSQAPPATAFLESRVMARGGDPWRCKECHKRHYWGVDERYFECVRQTECAGGCGRSPTVTAMKKTEIARRNYRAWYCRHCTEGRGCR